MFIVFVSSLVTIWNAQRYCFYATLQNKNHLLNRLLF